MAYTRPAPVIIEPSHDQILEEPLSTPRTRFVEQIGPSGYPVSEASQSVMSSANSSTRRLHEQEPRSSKTSFSASTPRIGSSGSNPFSPTAEVTGPFSPPASVVSFSLGADPFQNPHSEQNHLHARTSVHSSTQNSVIDLRPSIQRQSTISGVREAFASPPPRPLTYIHPSSDSKPGLRTRSSKKQRPQSTMLSGPVSKPWIKTKDIRARTAYFLTYGMILIGVAAAAVRCYFGWRDVPLVGNLCLVLEDQFDGAELDTEGVWLREADLGGFGNGEFEMTTASNNNSFIRNNQLYLLPTLTSSVIGRDAIFDDYTFNLTGCTNTNLTACGVVSNNTQGTVINPVMSARISTKGKKSIQYGRVEVRAKLPRGDWMWPAIWMLPENNTYGPWPLSGEIDIMEARGNSPDYPAQGINYVRGSLNWGPLTWLNAVAKTYGWWTERRSSYGQTFHTYALEWTEKFLRIYVDNRLQHMLDLRFNVPFFERGDFPASVSNASQEIILSNPWVGRGNSAPFDQPFYLILDVAVGGTNGWFPDGAGNKPWLNGALNAMQQFAQKQDEWSATWPEDDDDRAMRVDYVKMWQQC